MGKPNPRRGVMTYIHRQYIGKARMPKANSIAEHYAKEVGLVYTTKEEMFAAISADFKKFVEWMKINAGKMYNTY